MLSRTQGNEILRSYPLIIYIFYLFFKTDSQTQFIIQNTTLCISLGGDMKAVPSKNLGGSNSLGVILVLGIYQINREHKHLHSENITFLNNFCCPGADPSALLPEINWDLRIPLNSTSKILQMKLFWKIYN